MAKNEKAKRDIEIVVRENWKTIKQVVPDHITPERLARIAVVAIRINPQLASCSIATLMDSIVQAATLGIEPNDGTGRAWIVPFKGEASLMLGYKGMIDLAYRSGQIDLIDCQVIREHDDFDIRLGTTPDIRHVPSLESGKMRGVYSVVRIKGVEHPVIEFMNLDEIEKIKRTSKTTRADAPWKIWPEEMARKSCLKRNLKRCPLSTELHSAIALDDSHGIQIEDVLGQGRAQELLQQIASKGAETSQEAANLEASKETPEHAASQEDANPAQGEQEIIEEREPGADEDEEYYE